MAYTPIPVSDLTVSKDGTGIFDVLMRSTKEHLDTEFANNRIRGPEYSTVYLGSLQSTLEAAMAFLAQRHKLALETALLDKQIELATKEIEKADAQLAQIAAQTTLIEQQRLNAIVEGTVLVAQECKLRAEYDVIMLTKMKTTAETELLNQKKVTESAQISSTNVDPTSVLGRQASLYQAQTTGFARDAEQKAAKLLIDSWNVRRTTDEATSANTTNKLDDATVGQAVTKLLAGIGA